MGHPKLLLLVVVVVMAGLPACKKKKDEGTPQNTSSSGDNSPNAVIIGDPYYDGYGNPTGNTSAQAGIIATSPVFDFASRTPLRLSGESEVRIMGFLYPTSSGILTNIPIDSTAPVYGTSQIYNQPATYGISPVGNSLFRGRTMDDSDSINIQLIQNGADPHPSRAQVRGSIDLRTFFTTGYARLQTERRGVRISKIYIDGYLKSMVNSRYNGFAGMVTIVDDTGWSDSTSFVNVDTTQP